MKIILNLDRTGFCNLYQLNLRINPVNNGSFLFFPTIDIFGWSLRSPVQPHIPGSTRSTNSHGNWSNSVRVDTAVDNASILERSSHLSEVLVRLGQRDTGHRYESQKGMKNIKNLWTQSTNCNETI